MDDRNQSYRVRAHRDLSLVTSLEGGTREMWSGSGVGIGVAKLFGTGLFMGASHATRSVVATVLNNTKQFVLHTREP